MGVAIIPREWTRTNARVWTLVFLFAAAPVVMYAQAWDRAPVWSTTGVVAFVSNRDGDLEIYRVEPNGSGLRRLTQSAGLDVGPSWSPDGAQIAFLSARNGKRALWVMAADGSEPRRLTTRDDIILSRPAWLNKRS